jgi:hypothetical protein
MSDVTPEMLTNRVADVIRDHQLMGMPPPLDFTCRCGWTSEYPVSQWPQHVAEQIEADRFVALFRGALVAAASGNEGGP